MRGASRVGCLISLALFVAAAYAAVKVAGSEIDFRAIQGEVQTQARLAAESMDETIVNAIAAEAERLGLPESARRPSVQRFAGNRIRIALSYSDTVTFVGRWHWVRVRRIELEQPY